MLFSRKRYLNITFLVNRFTPKKHSGTIQVLYEIHVNLKLIGQAVREI